MWKINCPECGHTFEYEVIEAADLFEKWWLLYPRRIGKGHARKAYYRALTKINPDNLYAQTQKFAAVCKGVEKAFIKHPATWLNSEGWLDETISPVTPDSGLTKPSLAIPPSWKIYYPALCKEIGENKFHAWFGDSELTVSGDLNVVIAATTMKRDYIIRHFAIALHQLLGEFDVMVKPSLPQPSEQQSALMKPTPDSQVFPAVQRHCNKRSGQ